MKISKRLRVISDFIPDNSFLLDIGCDHALLDIYVTNNKKNVRAIAADINDKPLEKAKENKKIYKANKIKIVKADGLKAYTKGVDIVVISGLGSATIVNILNNDKNYLENIKKLVISSNNDYYYLRKNICSLGFYIKDETIVLDRKKFYPVILFEKGNKKYTKYEYKYGPILLNKLSDEYQKYLKQEKEKLIKIYNNLGLKYIIKKKNIKKEIKYITKKLENYKYY